ncbi:UNKNOWN [Stylonychia lemnae]|uniref:Uncharacterized protein n=1 Tax=Stylonychia lemnae TaxID=5949 RepID=A0A077ZPE8_STYLE|nr:UNKNOWN [Stylonychia lemnae]|eukprot:CDW71270.1 UNKNOWN [Stylonychia lemnae]
MQLQKAPSQRILESSPYRKQASHLNSILQNAANRGHSSTLVRQANGEAQTLSHAASVVSMQSSICSTNQVLESLKFSSGRSTINQLLSSKVFDNRSTINNNVACSPKLESPQSEVNVPTTESFINKQTDNHSSKTLFKTYDSQMSNLVQSNQQRKLMVKTDRDQYSFNKVLIQKIKEKLESPKKQLQKTSNTSSFLLKSARKSSRSKEKIPKFEYSEEKKIRDLEHVFFKTYSQVNVPKDNPKFHERMQFDIFKRNSREQRLDLVKQKSDSKQRTTSRDNLFGRLIEDGKRRAQFKEAKEKVKAQNHTIQNFSHHKPLTPKKSEDLYKRFMEQENQRQDKIQEQKRMKDISDEIQLLRSQGGRSNEKITKKRNNEIVNKLMTDTERRKMEKVRMEVVKDLVEQIANIDAKKQKKIGHLNRSTSKQNISSYYQKGTKMNSKPNIFSTMSDQPSAIQQDYYGSKSPLKKDNIFMTQTTNIKKLLEDQNINAIDVWKEYLKQDCTLQTCQNNDSSSNNNKNLQQLQESSIILFNTMRPSEEFRKESPEFRPKPQVTQIISYNNSNQTSNQKFSELNSNDSIMNLINCHQEQQQEVNFDLNQYDQTFECDAESLDESDVDPLSNKNLNLLQSSNALTSINNRQGKQAKDQINYQTPVKTQQLKVSEPSVQFLKLNKNCKPQFLKENQIVDMQQRQCQKSKGYLPISSRYSAMKQDKNDIITMENTTSTFDVNYID